MKLTHITPFYQLKSLFLVDVGEEEDTLGVPSTTPRQRFHYIIHFILKGEGTFQKQNPKSKTTSIIKAGDIFCIHKDDSVFYRSKPESPFHYFWIGFDGNEAKYIMDYLGLSSQIPVLHTKNPGEVLQAFQKLLLISKKGEKYSSLIAFFELINILKSNSSSNNISTSSNDTNKLLIRAKNYIKENLNKNIKVQDVTSYLNIDRSHFTKIFKKEFGYTPQVYIRNSKLKNAEYLLRNTDYSINEISALLAFTDVYCFSKLFKKQYGMSPMQYRKNKNT